MSGLATILAIALSSGCLAADSVHESPARGNAQVNEFPSALSMTKRKPVGMSLKTNAIPWTATIMNIAGEVNLSDKISLSVPVWWCPWFIGQSHALRVLALQPEGDGGSARPGRGISSARTSPSHGSTCATTISVTRTMAVRCSGQA